MHAKEIAVISDIHGNSWALKNVLRDIKLRKIKSIVNLGDSLYGPLDPAGTAKILMEHNIPAVLGNEDRIIINGPDSLTSPTLEFVKKSLKNKHIEWLKRLKMTKSINNEFFLCHGSPNNDMQYLLKEVKKNGVFIRKASELTTMLKPIKEKIVLCGHDHIPNTIYLPDGKLIVNPGSVGLQAFTDDIPFDHTMETGSPHARYSILSKEENGWTVKNISTSYNWQMAAKTASNNGRHDWALWLNTGLTKII